MTRPRTDRYFDLSTTQGRWRARAAGMDVPLRPSAGARYASRNQEWLALFRSGLSPKQVAEAVGKTEIAVRSILNKFGSVKRSALVTASCKECGQPFSYGRTQIHRRVYCSKSCMGLGFRKENIENVWRGGLHSDMRFKSRIDQNQNDIVEALQKEPGASVLVTSNMGGGFPDLLVGVPQNNLLLEIKNPKSEYGKKGLNKLQQAFHAWWPGPIYTIYTVDEAVQLVRWWVGGRKGPRPNVDGQNDRSEAA